MPRRDQAIPSLFLLSLLLSLNACSSTGAMVHGDVNDLLKQPDSWFTSPQGQKRIDNIISWQNPSGGWWKKYDDTHPRPAILPPPSTQDAGPGDTEDIWRRTSTFDNGATYSELRLVARAYKAHPTEACKDAFNRGLDFIFASQYPNGGWPQRFPLENNYGRYITFNDNVMTELMRLLKDISDKPNEFPPIPDSKRTQCRQSFERALECTLNCQVKVNGKLTVWGQQHDPQTLELREGRAFELPALCAGESSNVLLFLMSLPNPTPRIRTSIESGSDWYQQVEIHGKRWVTLKGPQYEGGSDRALVDDPTAPPLWARFYEVPDMKPFVADRDGVKHYSVTEISRERRRNYSWYGRWGAKVLKTRLAWRKAIAAGPTTASAIEIDTDTKILVSQDLAVGDVHTIQSAIDRIPSPNTNPCVILIKPGTYKERIEIPRTKPFITFRATDPDPTKTILTNDWYAQYTPPSATQPVGTGGSASVTIDANDFTAENLTFQNTAGDKGQAVALKITGDREILRNCRLLGWQDTLYADSGRQYYSNCYIEGRTDFIFGGATAIFDKCTISSKNGGYITAARTPPDQPFGYVFLDCTLIGEGQPAYLGRPWQWDRGRKAAVAFIHCRMGPHIRPEGWNQWDRPNNPNTQPANTARYFEFDSTDLDDHPLDVSHRVPWSHQLSADQAKDYTIRNILSDSDDWDPNQ